LEYFSDYLVPMRAFAHRSDFKVVTFSLIMCFVAIIIHGADVANAFEAHKSQAIQVGMLIAMTRMFFINESCLQLLYSFARGLTPLISYMALMSIVFYIFTRVLVDILKGKLHVGTLEECISGQKPCSNCDTFSNCTKLTFQMFIAEGWHEVADQMSQATSSTLNFWTMLFYVFLSLLFAQLTVGIIISLYTSAEERRDVGREIYIIIGELYGGGKTKQAIDAIVYKLGRLEILLEWASTVGMVKKDDLNVESIEGPKRAKTPSRPNTSEGLPSLPREASVNALKVPGSQGSPALDGKQINRLTRTRSYVQASKGRRRRKSGGLDSRSLDDAALKEAALEEERKRNLRRLQAQQHLNQRQASIGSPWSRPQSRTGSALPSPQEGNERFNGGLQRRYSENFRPELLAVPELNLVQSPGMHSAPLIGSHELDEGPQNKVRSRRRSASDSSTSLAASLAAMEALPSDGDVAKADDADADKAVGGEGTDKVSELPPDT